MTLTSDAELQRLSKHVYYEVWMLFETSEKLRALRRMPAEASAMLETVLGVNAIAVLTNSLIESFAVHLRCLNDFLYAGAGGHELCARDFVDDWCQRHTLNEIDALATARAWSDELVGHLTCGRRGDPGDRGWNQKFLLRTILPALEKFCASVPQQRSGAKLSTLADLLANKARDLALRPPQHTGEDAVATRTGRTQTDHLETARIIASWG